MFRGSGRDKKHSTSVMNVNLCHEQSGYVNITNIGKIARVSNRHIHARLKSLVVYDTSLKTVLNQIGVAKVALDGKTIRAMKTEVARLDEQFTMLKNHPKLKHLVHIVRVESRWVLKECSQSQLLAMLSFDTGAVQFSRVRALTGVAIKCTLLSYDDYIANIDTYIGNAKDAGCGITGRSDATASARDRAKLADILQAMGRCRDMHQYKYMDVINTWDVDVLSDDAATIKNGVKNQKCVDITQWRSGVNANDIDVLLEDGQSANFGWVIHKRAKLSSRQTNQLKYHSKFMKILLKTTKPNNSTKIQARNRLGHVIVSCNSAKELYYEQIYRRFGSSWADFCSVWKYDELNLDDWCKIKKLFGRNNERVFRLIFQYRGDHIHFHEVFSN